MFLDKLSKQQTAIAGLVAEGYSNDKIASLLCIDVKTVEKHLNIVYQKLSLYEGVEGRNKRIALAIQYNASRARARVLLIP